MGREGFIANPIWDVPVLVTSIMKTDKCVKTEVRLCMKKLNVLAVKCVMRWFFIRSDDPFRVSEPKNSILRL